MEKLKRKVGYKNVIKSMVNLSKIVDCFVGDFLSCLVQNNADSILLFAISVLCVLHPFQCHLTVFLLSMLTLLMAKEKRIYFLRALGIFVGVLCLATQSFTWISSVPVQDTGLNKTDTNEMDFLEDSKPWNETSIFEGFERMVWPKIPPLVLLDQSIEDKQEFARLLLNYFGVLMLTTIYLKVVHSELSELGTSVMFPKITAQNADKNVMNLLKYLMNYGQYIFSVEVCWFAVALQVCFDYSNLDIGPLVAQWFCLRTPRENAVKSWRYLMMSLVTAICFKYVIHCHNQPFVIFSNWSPLSNHNIIQLLPKNYVTTSELIGNLVVLFLVHQQYRIFQTSSYDYATSPQIKNCKKLDNDDGEFLEPASSILRGMQSYFLPWFPEFVLSFIFVTSVNSKLLLSIVYTWIVTRTFLDGTLNPTTSLSVRMRRIKVLLICTLTVICVKFVILATRNYVTSHSTETYCLVWTLFSLQCPQVLPDGNVQAGGAYDDMISNSYMDAIYIGLLLLLRNYVGSCFFESSRTQAQLRRKFSHWGPALLRKAAQEQNHKKQIRDSEKIGKGINIEKEDNLSLLEGFKLEYSVFINKREAFPLTRWLWDVSTCYAFVEFSLQQLVKDHSAKTSIETPENPTNDYLNEVWNKFMNLNPWKESSKWQNLFQALLLCLKAHSQYCCYMLMFLLQGSEYGTFYTVFLPLSILWATWVHPRPPVLYWKVLMNFTIVMILVKLSTMSLLYELYLQPSIGFSISNLIGNGPPFLEVLLLCSVLWHRSILKSHGLWKDHQTRENEMPERVGTTDVYVAITLLQVFALLTVSLGYSSFAAEHSEAGVIDFVKTDNVPLSATMIMLSHVLIMCVSRIAYVVERFWLTASVHVCVWIASHIWLFFYTPVVTHRKIGQDIAPVLYYLVLGAYLLLQGYQVRTRHMRSSPVSILCQGFGKINYTLFFLYTKIPILEPVRRLLDFFFTKTLLTREESVIIDSIFTNAFLVKCEQKFKPTRKDRKTKSKIMAAMGVLCTFGMLAFLAAPMVYYIIDAKYGALNPIEFFKMELSSPPLGTLYHQQAQNIEQLTAQDWNTLFTSTYADSRRAKTFLGDFTYEDVFVVHLPLNSLEPWHPARTRANIATHVRKAPQISFQLKWEAERLKRESMDYGSITWSLRNKPHLNSNDSENPMDLLARNILSTNYTFMNDTPLLINHIMPKFILFTKNQFASPIPQLSVTGHRDGAYDVLLELNSANQVWKLREQCEGEEYKKHFMKLPKHSSCTELDIYLFSDRPPLIEFLVTFGGMIGIYSFIVFGLKTILTGWLERDIPRIMFEEIESIDRILQAGYDIYRYRLMGEIELEVTLASKLIEVYSKPMEYESWTSYSHTA